eukprot:2517780-Alexandrium_andersonii.AAC.1
MSSLGRTIGPRPACSLKPTSLGARRPGAPCAEAFSLRGARAIKRWSTAQKTIALSTGEAELAGIVKGAAEGLRLTSVLLDLGLIARLQ